MTVPLSVATHFLAPSAFASAFRRGLRVRCNIVLKRLYLLEDDTYPLCTFSQSDGLPVYHHLLAQAQTLFFLLSSKLDLNST